MTPSGISLLMNLMIRIIELPAGTVSEEIVNKAQEKLSLLMDKINESEQGEDLVVG